LARPILFIFQKKLKSPKPAKDTGGAVLRKGITNPPLTPRKLRATIAHRFHLGEAR
tara:strand:- start:806 stop:973 length:168 start_codon:yes stop_codon:yes gene_type:complete